MPDNVVRLKITVDPKRMFASRMRSLQIAHAGYHLLAVEEAANGNHTEARYLQNESAAMWLMIHSYRRASDQVSGQSPMGTDDDGCAA